MDNKKISIKRLRDFFFEECTHLENISSGLSKERIHSHTPEETWSWINTNIIYPNYNQWIQDNCLSQAKGIKQFSDDEIMEAEKQYETNPKPLDKGHWFNGAKWMQNRLFSHSHELGKKEVSIPVCHDCGNKICSCDVEAF